MIPNNVKKIIDDGLKKASYDFGRAHDYDQWLRDNRKVYSDGESAYLRYLAFGKAAELTKEK